MSHTCLFPAFECVECLERLGITDSSRMIVAFARLVDRYLRVDPAPLLDIPAARNWICTAIQSHLPELIENWRGENLPQLLERAHELVPVDWVDLHAELLSYCHGSQAYEWASRKLRAKGFNLSMDQQIDLTEGFLQSGVLARSVSGFDLRKGGGKEASWLKTVYYRYALRELLRRGRARALDDLPDPPAPGPTPYGTFAGREVSRLLDEGLRGLPPDEHDLVALYFGLGTCKHTLRELVPAFGPTVYKVRKRLVTDLGALGARLGSMRRPVLVAETTDWGRRWALRRRRYVATTLTSTRTSSDPPTR